MAKTAKTETSAAWTHPFTAAGMGDGPFTVIGFSRELYQACPGAPMQPGASCARCGAGLVNVYRVRNPAGDVYPVGIDCVERTGDTELGEAARKAERSYRYEQREQATAAERAMRAEARAAAQAARAAYAARECKLLIELCRIIGEAEGASDYAKGIAARVRREVSEGIRDVEAGGDLYDYESAALGEAWLLHTLPPSRHLGKVGERLRGVRAVYMGGPKWVSDFGYRTVSTHLAIFRVMDGPNAGAAFTWKTSGGIGVETPDDPRYRYDPAKRGDVIELTGTVKEHSEYKGKAQSALTRCKVTAIVSRACVVAE